MEQIYTLLCSFTLFILEKNLVVLKSFPASLKILVLDSWMFNVTNICLTNNFKDIQEFSRTPENIQGQEDDFWESRT